MTTKQPQKRKEKSHDAWNDAFRHEIAKAAMAAIIACPHRWRDAEVAKTGDERTIDVVARWAYDAADAMFKASGGGE